MCYIKNFMVNYRQLHELTCFEIEVPSVNSFGLRAWAQFNLYSPMYVQIILFKHLFSASPSRIPMEGAESVSY